VSAIAIVIKLPAKMDTVNTAITANAVALFVRLDLISLVVFVSFIVSC
jgi:hypothetical protein